jgi:integrase/recombinase XerD
VVALRAMRPVRVGPDVLRAAEVRSLLAAPDRRRRLGKRDAALLAVLVGGGLRLGEAVSLTLDNLDFGPGGRVRLTLQTSKTRHLRLRTVTLPDAASSLVTAYVGTMDAGADWLFPGNKGGHLTVRAAEKICKRHLSDIGRGGSRAHCLRHTFGSMVTRETRSLFVAQKLLGHADPATTSRYYAAFEVSDADAAARAIGRLFAGRKPPQAGKGQRTEIVKFAPRAGRRSRALTARGR